MGDRDVVGLLVTDAEVDCLELNVEIDVRVIVGAALILDVLVGTDDTEGVAESVGVVLDDGVAVRVIVEDGVAVGVVEADDDTEGVDVIDILGSEGSLFEYPSFLQP